MDPFRFVADGVVSSARLRRPAELTTPSAPLLWLRGIFLMAQPSLLCEEGNMTHSSYVQTATSSTFGGDVAVLCLLWLRTKHVERFELAVQDRIGSLEPVPTGTACCVDAAKIFGEGE